MIDPFEKHLAVAKQNLTVSKFQSDTQKLDKLEDQLEYCRQFLRNNTEIPTVKAVNTLEGFAQPNHPPDSYVHDRIETEVSKLPSNYEVLACRQAIDRTTIEMLSHGERSRYFERVTMDLCMELTKQLFAQGYIDIETHKDHARWAEIVIAHIKVAPKTEKTDWKGKL